MLHCFLRDKPSEFKSFHRYAADHEPLLLKGMSKPL